jgi:cytochrome P450
MKTVKVADYGQILEALKNPGLAQSLYDEGKVIMEGVLLTLHGEAHRARRNLEFRVFRRNFFRYYEQEVFPATLKPTLAPFVAQGHADLVQLGYRVTMNLTADFAGIDRPLKTEAETEALIKIVKTFSEGATLVHSTRNKDEVRAEVRAAMIEFERVFLGPSIAARQDMIRRHAKGEIAEEELPRDVLTVLLRNEDRLEISPDLLLREMSFYMQAGSHSTANSTVHAAHEIFEWSRKHPEERKKIDSDPIFLQRCVHESLRLHPASPEAWRRPVCPMSVVGQEVGEGDRIVLDLHGANRDKTIFGDDADEFNPYRTVQKGREVFGLTFGTGIHTCLGRDLDGGLLPTAATHPDEHQYGIITLLVRELLREGARQDPKNQPQQDKSTARPVWGKYPVLLGKTKE